MRVEEAEEPMSPMSPISPGSDIDQEPIQAQVSHSKVISKVTFSHRADLSLSPPRPPSLLLFGGRG